MKTQRAWDLRAAKSPCLRTASAQMSREWLVQPAPAMLFATCEVMGYFFPLMEREQGRALDLVHHANKCDGAMIV